MTETEENSKRLAPGPAWAFRSREFWISNLFRISSLAWCFGVFLFAGCLSDQVDEGTTLTAYQRQLAEEGPQPRVSMGEFDPAQPVGLLQPVEPTQELLPRLEVTTDPNTGEKTLSLNLEQAITRALANSPEIRVVSFDPQIARQEITKAIGEFDPTAFSRVFYEDQDAPRNSFFEPGEAEQRLFESGIRQRTSAGSEWSASYALARNWDDLLGRTLRTRYEPMLIFQLKQPLWRDAWEEVNLAGVNIARLEHEIALVGFRDRAEDLSAQVIAAYWRLVQALRSLEVQQELVEQTIQTLQKVENRREIDATDVQLMQARAYAKVREANLLEFQKLVKDAQDDLARLMADSQINTTTELTIVPETAPERAEEPPDLAKTAENALATAMLHNPAVQEAQVRVEIAEINVRVADNQKMPRLDLIASARAQGLAAHRTEAHEQMDDLRYETYGVGLTLEYPLGNRQREAELIRRRLERRKAVAVLHNTADQVAVAVKEKARKVQTTLEQIDVQKTAAEAALAQLKALEESEPIRERLTPEFLLVKLQAQDTYAQARRSEITALIEFHIAQAELARTTGTVLKLHRVENALTTVTEPSESEGQDREPEPRKQSRPDLLPAGFLYSLPATQDVTTVPGPDDSKDEEREPEPPQKQTVPNLVPAGVLYSLPAKLK